MTLVLLILSANPQLESVQHALNWLENPNEYAAPNQAQPDYNWSKLQRKKTYSKLNYQRPKKRVRKSYNTRYVTPNVTQQAYRLHMLAAQRYQRSIHPPLCNTRRRF